VFQQSKRKRVLLLVETIRNGGRQIIEGILRYTVEKKPLEYFFFSDHSTEQLPSWIKRWQGDGIIIRSFNENCLKIIDPVLHVGHF